MNNFGKILWLFAVSLIVISCNDKSLQKYLVEKQDDSKFVKMDIAPSLLEGRSSHFTPEEREVLNTIKKINVVAYPITHGDTVEFKKEMEELEKILAQEEYKELTRMKSSKWKATLKYTGEEDAIDELIVYASDNDRGFAVFRVLGENMQPDRMLQLFKSAEKDDLDFSKFVPLENMFKD